jgi:hypothetical protein
LSKIRKKHIGSTLDSLFDELGEREEVELLTQKKASATRVNPRCSGVTRISREP